MDWWVTRQSNAFTRRSLKSRARDPGGTGLGLAIMKHLIELHGGTSAPNTGPKAALDSC